MCGVVAHMDPGVDRPGDRLRGDRVADRGAFGLIARQQCVAAPAVERSDEPPAQRGRVGDPGVHPEPAHGHPQVRRVTGEEDVAVAPTIRDQGAGDPTTPVEQRVVERLADGGEHRLLGIPGRRVFTVGHRGVDEPPVRTVDRDEDRPARGRPQHPTRHPCGDLGHARRAEVGGAHVVESVDALQICTDRVAHDARATVGSHEEAAVDRGFPTGVDIAQSCGDPTGVLVEAGELPAFAHLDIPTHRGGPAQDGFEEELRNEVLRFRGRPVRRDAVLGAGPDVVGSRAFVAGDRHAVQSGHVHDVGRMGRWQARGAHRVGAAEAAEQLHRPGVRRVALRVGRHAASPVDDDRVHPEAGQVHREGDADGSGSDDEHRGRLDGSPDGGIVLARHSGALVPAGAGDAAGNVGVPHRIALRPWPAGAHPGRARASDAAARGCAFHAGPA